MNAAERLAAREQQARTRTVHGWAFRDLDDAEKDAIKAFLAGGPCPPSYRRLYDLARAQLRLPPVRTCTCGSTIPDQHYSNCGLWSAAP